MQIIYPLWTLVSLFIKRRNNESIYCTVCQALCCYIAVFQLTFKLFILHFTDKKPNDLRGQLTQLVKGEAWGLSS